MDNKSLGGFFGGFGHKYSGQECSIPASTNCDSTATAYGASQRSHQLSIRSDGMDVKKKRVSKITGGGLRQISITVLLKNDRKCHMRAVNYIQYNRSLVGKKVESKGRTTYSEDCRPPRLTPSIYTKKSYSDGCEVADEIVAEFTEANSSFSLDKVEEKNIRRRVYDALNVLMALDIIVKEGKEIRWKGLPSTDVKDMEQNKALRVKLMNQIGKKAAYLKDLEEQITGLQNLMLRNHHLLASGNSPSGGFSLPFIVVRTNPHATVEIEISEDMQLVHFDFNSTPFSLHDDAYILKLLRCYQHPESRNNSQNSSVLSSSSSDIASGGTKSFCWNSEMDMSK